MTTESEALSQTDDRAPRVRRFDPLAVSGALFTIAMFAASAPEDPASTTAEGLREHLATSGGAWQTYAILMAVSAAVLVVFLAHLRAVLVPASRATGRATALPDAAFGAGLLVGAWLLASAGLTAVAAVADLDTIDDTTLLSWWGLGEAGDMIGLAVFTMKGLVMVAAGVAVLRTRALGAWLGWLSIALGVLTWAALFIPPVFYAGIFGFALWPLAVSIALIVRGLGRRGAARTAV